MLKEWQTPTLVIFDDRQITSNPTGFNQHEKAYYCKGSVKVTLLPPAAGVSSFCIPPAGAGGKVYPGCNAAGTKRGVRGVSWFNLRDGGKRGTLSTPLVTAGACS